MKEKKDEGPYIDKKMARELGLPEKPVQPLTLQDLIDFAKEQGVEPSRLVLLTRESCMTGGKQYDLLLKPQLKKRAKALDPITDEHVDIPMAVSLIKPWWL